ncbi:zinc finger protein 585A-like isoform X1 [Aphis craccivora]|uniref:Zinc finger protein 585A-like isoform X1 n=1 Tax=Aphis craccivora TaxID=307492 RepID=A0A6G0YSC1_APHCR|nr:zinc finger protein 585A-like isoform X1 [Aphis craccivora]
MIGKTLAANSNRRDAITRLHMEHQDQSPFYSKQTFVAASYLPANCGTTTVDVMDLLYNGSLHSFPSGNDHESSSTGRKTFRPPIFKLWSVEGRKPKAQTVKNSVHKKNLVSVDDAGRLVYANGHRCSKADCSCWILSVPLADDCHAYNCRLSRLAVGTIGLHTTSAVMAGQPLKMWFSSDLQLMLHVPFLTPVNIKVYTMTLDTDKFVIDIEKHVSKSGYLDKEIDERKYVCHKCGYACENPNPLKIHMALDCGKQPRAKLWSRLTANHCENSQTIEASFRFSLTSAESQTPLSSASVDSAFRPYSPVSSVSSGSCPIPPSPFHPPPPAPLSSSLSDQTPLQDEPLGQVNGRKNSAFFNQRCAEMETIVSNLGHSDQGHLCIYCGKVYSRKYGLKIHIRTHTGFKPLKCKYCYRPFGDPSNLNKHVRLHAEGDTPYKCDCCGKILVRKRDLERHMKSRHSQILSILTMIILMNLNGLILVPGLKIN